MRTMSNDEFADAVMRIADGIEPSWPQVTYIPEGDCLEFVTAPDDYRAERIDGLVTVFYSRETGEIVGSLIKGVKGFCARLTKRLPGFMIEIHAGPVKLSHLFLARLWMEDLKIEDMTVRTYRRLVEVAEQANAKAELCTA